jgi:hypothetical protein
MVAVRRLVRRLLRREPARTIGAVAGALVLVADLLTELADATVNVPTWSAALPIIVGFVLRRFVYAPATVEFDIEEYMRTLEQPPDDAAHSD